MGDVLWLELLREEHLVYLSGQVQEEFSDLKEYNDGMKQLIAIISGSYCKFWQEPNYCSSDGV